MRSVKGLPVTVGDPVQQRGFTLIELMLTLTIASLLTMVAVPSFSRFIAQQELAGDVNQLNSALTYARSEAIKQRQPVTVTFFPPEEFNGVRRPEGCREGEQINESGENYRYAYNSWCYTVKKPKEGDEASVLRAGVVNITQPKDRFSIVFESLGDADTSDCGTECGISVSPREVIEDVDPVTLIVRPTGSIHKEGQ